MKNYKELLIWQKGMDIWKETYQLSKELPREEKYGLISQVQRASASIPANIAEGSARESTKNYHYFLQIALGSCFELETFIIGMVEMQMVDKVKADELLSKIDEEQKMIMSFMKKVKSPS
ncbi:four helix bundle protein [Tunicatimonas pelagia]|uniref:four helix bundle protein n=1 Tax=Tunicatimonas pelagia TaxID=931531 RepID=UPI002666EF23|nr:four helix bundle protein [Tunicatimonas pelagia]WKN42989.1 four helix bundle protein [Tunicatimonas pelagia]